MALDILIGVALVLGVIILIHEWGHFIVARLFGVRVDVFSIGFGPRLFGWKKGATDYRISMLPLGGYVRMAGQDPSEVDSGNTAPTGASDELMSKPRWQRALIAFAGPAINFVFPVILLFGFCAILGMPFLKLYRQPMVVSYFTTVTPGSSPLKVGDRVVALNDVKNPDWEKGLGALDRMDPNAPVTITVSSNGSEHTISTTAKEAGAVDAFGVRKFFGYPASGAVLDIADRATPAHRAGLRDGDKILEVDGKPIAYWGEFVDSIRTSGGRSLGLKVQRQDKTFTTTVTPQEGLSDPNEKVWQIGVQNHLDVGYDQVSLAQAGIYAFGRTEDFFGQTVGVVKKLFTGRVPVKQLRSFLGIAQASGDAVRRGPLDTILLMAFISVNLGILNLLPIPILDGGMIMMLTIEGLLRRDLSLPVKERFVQVGFVFLLLLFAYVMYNDVARMITSHS
jgi:regulator of sigma E protease